MIHSLPKYEKEVRERRDKGRHRRRDQRGYGREEWKEEGRGECNIGEIRERLVVYKEQEREQKKKKKRKR